MPNTRNTRKSRQMLQQANQPQNVVEAPEQSTAVVAAHSTAIAAINAIQHIVEAEMAAHDGPTIDGEIITDGDVGSVESVLGASSHVERPVDEPDIGEDESEGDEADESVLNPAATYEGKPLLEIVAEVADKDRKKMATKIGKAFDDRGAYETDKNASNERIHKELKKSREKLAMPGAAAILIAAQVDAGFINRSVANGSRFNVYAADKLADLVKGLQEGGSLKNKVNIAVCKSMFRFRAAGESFTGEMAKAAVCDKVKVDNKMQKLLVRHTVDPGTMSTQTSSTMTALMTLGIVKNEGTFRAPVYVLTETPQTARLQELVAA